MGLGTNAADCVNKSNVHLGLQRDPLLSAIPGCQGGRVQSNYIPKELWEPSGGIESGV